jgi:hypothetical protein
VWRKKMKRDGVIRFSFIVKDKILFQKQRIVEVEGSIKKVK